jgi:hypothetical protein
MTEAEKFKAQGLDFFKSGEYETAVRYFTNAIVRWANKKMDNQNSMYFLHRAECYKELEEFDKVGDN